MTFLLILAAILAGAGSGQAQERQTEETVRQRTGQQLEQRERVYGGELMTEQERTRYQEHLQATKTEQERKQFKTKHKEEMQERARQQGKVLDGDGNVLSGDQLRERDQDRDRARQTNPTSRPATAPTPRQGGGRGGG